VFAIVAATRGEHQRVVLKTDLDDTAPSVESWAAVYPGADWHERETWEMFGIEFTGHPALRHLYLPFEFEGHPLRKDYPLLAREVKPWPGLVDVEPMPGEDGDDEGAAAAVEASS
jgi:NADH-quinone oxidoreductase subunit C